MNHLKTLRVAFVISLLVLVWGSLSVEIEVRAQSPLPPKPVRGPGMPIPVGLPSATFSHNLAPETSSAAGEFTRIAFQSHRKDDWEIYSGDTATTAVNITNHPAVDAAPNLNRGANKIVFQSNRNGSYDIYAMNIDGSSLTQLTHSSGDKWGAVWSADGQQIAYVSDPYGISNIYIMNANGQDVKRLTDSPVDNFSPTWSPDGTQIACAQHFHDTVSRIQVVNVSSKTFYYVYYSEGSYMGNVGWSPDGKWLIYDADVDNDGWNELVRITPRGENREIIYDPHQPLVDAWFGSWAPEQDGVIFTRVEYRVEENQLYISAAYLEKLTFGAGVSRIGNYPRDMNPSWMSLDGTAPHSQVIELPQYMRAGSFTVNWLGLDRGPSSLLNYDVQYRKESDLMWTDWKEGTTETSGILAGNLGDTIFFRSRARDRAHNVEQWPAGNGDLVTHIFRNLVNGEVRDNRGIPLSGVNISIQPSAFESPTTGREGHFQAHYYASDALHVQASKTGYGALPTLLRGWTGDQDINITIHLPPVDDQVKNGGFEEQAGSLPGWTVSGDFPPSSQAFHHSGVLGARFGLPETVSVAQVGILSVSSRLSGQEHTHPDAAGDAILSQTVTIPYETYMPTLSLAYWFKNAGNGAAFYASLDGTPVITITEITKDWAYAWADLTPFAGRPVKLELRMTGIDPLNPASLYLDEVSIGSWPTPYLLAVSPERLDDWSSAVLTLSGDNFNPNTQVLLNGMTQIDVDWINENTLQLGLDPALPLGLYTVTVVNSGGANSSLPGALLLGRRVYLPVAAR